MFGGRKPPQPASSTQTMAQAPSIANIPQNARQPVGFESVLGANCSLKGELHSHANVRLDGNLDGHIVIEGNLLLGETARINADVHAQNITIAGAVRGNIVGQRVQMLRSGRVWGDISASSIVTEEGAFIEGTITMTGHPASKGFEQLPAPNTHVIQTLAEDATSGEPLEVEVMDDHPSSTGENS